VISNRDQKEPIRLRSARWHGFWIPLGRPIGFKIYVGGCYTYGATVNQRIQPPLVCSSEFSTLEIGARAPDGRRCGWPLSRSRFGKGSNLTKLGTRNGPATSVYTTTVLKQTHRHSIHRTPPWVRRVCISESPPAQRACIFGATAPNCCRARADRNKRLAVPSINSSNKILWDMAMRRTSDVVVHAGKCG